MARLEQRIVPEVSELTLADLRALDVERATKAPAVKRLSERHHALARCLAEGMSETEACVITGYCASRVSILQADPSFRNLIEHYRGAVAAAYANLHSRLAGLSVDAADMLRDRMEEEPEKIGTAHLMEIVKLGADRTGHGPQSTSTQLNVNVNLAERLQAARKRVIEGKVEAENA